MPENLQAALDQPVFHLLSRCAEEMDLDCYVIGGYVRDLILQRPSKDIDVVVVGSGIEFARHLKELMGRNTHLAVFKNFGTAQLKWHGIEIELVGARRESYQRDSRKPIVEDGTLEDDQNRRDFTVNALALSLRKRNFGELMDPFEGMRDIRYKMLRTPLDPAVTFCDDPLRIMRCIRFATQLSFHIEERTFRALTENKNRLSIISAERIVDELNKIMLSPRPSVGFQLMDQSGILPVVLPEIDKLKGVEVINGKGHKDIFLHTLQVVDHVAEAGGGLWLRWAALLHDVGKPATKKFDPKAGWTFYNHNYIGSRMVSRIFKRLKMPLNEKMKYVEKIVDLHMRPIALVEDEITDSAVRRLLFEAGDDIEDLMTLCEADITSRNEEKVKKFKENLLIVRGKLKDIEQKDHVRNFQPPVSGDEIMRTFGLAPCHEVGDIKSVIKEAILDGRIPNEYEAARRLMFETAAQMGLHPADGTTQS
ncbi:MAG: HD domain-containing protein [Paludibacteraceae bacterium]|nr:HD domain-containing protein [Paludibacteraceae bacterium]